MSDKGTNKTDEALRREAERRARSEAALKANLKRRKQQARERADSDAGVASPPGPGKGQAG